MGRWSARHRKIAIFGWLGRARKTRTRDRRRNIVAITDEQDDEGDRQREESGLAEVLAELSLDLSCRAAVTELGDRQM
jgi:hypothetical protein